MASSFIPSPNLIEKNGMFTPSRRRANTVIARNDDACFQGCSARHVNSESFVQCRFSYATWCPICENEERCKTIHQVRRRRSKSEGMDIEKSDDYYNKASSSEMFKPKSSLSYPKNHQYSMTNLKSSDSCDYYLAPQKVHHSHSLVQTVLDSYNVNSDEKIIKPMCKPCENHLEPKRGYYKTWNYFEKDQYHSPNKKADKFRPLHERYYNEVEILRNKLHELKDSSTDNTKMKQLYEFSAPNLSSVEVGLKRPRDYSHSLNRPKTSPCSSRKVNCYSCLDCFYFSLSV